jgi:hypothetical protein
MRIKTYTAPRLSEFETNKYSLPSSRRRSSTPVCTATRRPGGYQSFLSSDACLGHSCNVSFVILGYRDWLKVVMLISWDTYFLMIRNVSSCVLKDVMRMSGMWTLCVVFKCSTCCTIRSKKVIPSFTSRALFAPLMPLEHVRTIVGGNEQSYP